MYIFVFMWTPALESTSVHGIYHGWIFASFMICVFIGSTLFKYFLDHRHSVEKTAVYIFAVASVSLAVPIFFKNHTFRLISFFVFEICVGMFWPSSGLMRSRYVPEEVRATVMNIFRIPLNIIVVLVLANISKLDETGVFIATVLCLLPALACQIHLVSLTVESPAHSSKKETEKMKLTENHDHDQDGGSNDSHHSSNFNVQAGDPMEREQSPEAIPLKSLISSNSESST